ncbi:Neurogenic locus Notch protein [Diplonema papillatum]|nr:Neurogenic locus Notch protein [Diplonema papillatum]
MLFRPSGVSTTLLAVALFLQVGHAALVFTRNPDWLWDKGRVRYLVESGSAQGTDWRVERAVQTWEKRTCVTFEKCSDASSCQTPHVVFRNSPGNTFSAPSGIDRANGNVSVVELTDACGTGAVLHLIGKVLGLLEEHLRGDRDSFLVLRSASSLRAPAGAEELGEYDYASIMHGGRVWDDGSVVVWPHGLEGIGQRRSVSDKDAAAISHLYNGCEVPLGEVVCGSTRTGTVDVAVDQPFFLATAAQYSNSLVANSPTLASVLHRKHTFWDSSRFPFLAATIRFRFVGEYSISVTYTPKSGGGGSCTTGMEIRVSNNGRCFATDRGVCSGNGACKAGACNCKFPHTGAACEYVSSCSADVVDTFDGGGSGGWELGGGGGVDSGTFSAGGASLRVGDGGTAVLPLPRAAYASVSFRVSAADSRAASISFFDGTTECFKLETGADGWTLDKGDGVRAANGDFVRVNLNVDWTQQTVQLYMNGVEASDTDVECKGLEEVKAVGPLWIDEFAALCGGSVAIRLEKEVRREDIREGGTMLTLVIQGGTEEWAQSLKTKTRVVAGLTAGETVENGWNELKLGIVNTRLVNFPDSKSMTIGPFRSCADYDARVNEAITLLLTNSMFVHGAVPMHQPIDTTFTIDNECSGDAYYGFNDHAVDYGTDFVVAPGMGQEGTGALKVLSRENSTGDFTCECSNGVRSTGAAATCLFDECAAEPCGDMQNCLDRNDSFDSRNDFVCTCRQNGSITSTGSPSSQCPFDECAEPPCILPNSSCASGTFACEQVCDDSNTANSSRGDFTCVCTGNSVYRAVGSPVSCLSVEVDECDPSPCGVDASCEDPDKHPFSLADYNSTGDFTCECSNGVRSTGAAATCLFDECAAEPCGDMQNCLDRNDSFDSRNDFVCTCRQNGSITSTGSPSSQCPFDECAEPPCILPNSSCASGTFACEQVCDDSNTANSSRGDFTCVCTGNSVYRAVGSPVSCLSVEVDECDPSPCGVDASCEDPDKHPFSLADYNSTGDFTCECSNGVRSTGAAATCLFDECAAEPCGDMQNCLDRNDSFDSRNDFVCTCRQNGSITSTGSPSSQCPFDECAEPPCILPNSSCASGTFACEQVCDDSNTANSSRGDFTCVCTGNSVYRAVGSPVSCLSVEVDECDPSPCGVDASCEDPDKHPFSLSDYVCTCSNGQNTSTGSPAVCTIDECAEPSMPCGTDQNCTDPNDAILDDFVCTCTTFGTGTSTGKPASCDLNECDARPCGAEQKCSDANVSFDSKHDFRCTCLADDKVFATGAPAVCPEDECASSPCGAGQHCSDTDKRMNSTGDFTCECSNGVRSTGAAATCLFDECAAEPCGDMQNCLDRNDSFDSRDDYVCTCRQNGSITSTGSPSSQCPFDECAEPPCILPNSSCASGTFACEQVCDDPNTANSSRGDFTCVCTGNSVYRAVGSPVSCLSVEVDECDPSPCGVDASCVDPDKHPFSLSDYVCKRDECGADPCGEGQVCEDTDQLASSIGGFTCSCPGGTAVTRGAPAECVDECFALPCGTNQSCTDPDWGVHSKANFECTCSNGKRAVGIAAVCVHPSSTLSFVPEGQREAVRKVVEASAAGAVAFGGMGMTLAVLGTFQCEMDDLDLQEAEPLDWEFHPLRIGIGTGHDRFFRGAAIMNPLLLAGIGTILLAFVAHVRRADGVSWKQAMGSAKMPGVLHLPTMFLLQGTSLVSARLAFSSNDYSRILGSVVLFACAATPVALYYLVVRKIPTECTPMPDPVLFPDDSTVKRLSIVASCPPPKPMTGWKRTAYEWVFGSVVQVSVHPDQYFSERWGYVCDVYRQEMAVFACLEAAVMVAISLLSAWRPTSHTACNIRNTIVCIVLLAFATALHFCTPFLSQLDNVCVRMVSSLMFCAMLLMTLGIWLASGQEGTLFVASGWFLFGSAVVAVCKGVLDSPGPCEAALAQTLDAALLWPAGKVNYVVDVASGLDAADDRVVEAVLHWQTHSCVRFTKCADAGSCAKPYMQFKKGTACAGPVGVDKGNGDVNVVTLSDTCGAGILMNLIGHSIGLLNEQQRHDRDGFITVDTAAATAAGAGELSVAGATARDLGPYDYDSIMHDGHSAFASGSSATIHAPGWHEIGQRKDLSKGDTAAVDFMYNMCTATQTEPSCMLSRDASLTETIPYGAKYKTSVTARYGSELTVSYASSTAPTSEVVFSAADATKVGKNGYVSLEFTPTAAEDGKTFKLGATFTAADGKSVTCTHTVKVHSDAVCFGLPSDDPLVCSGHGKCTKDRVHPCTCDAGFGGIECDGSADCEEDHADDFDTGTINPWTSSSASVADPVVAASGSSLRVGDADDLTKTGAAALQLGKMHKANRVTLHAAVPEDSVSSVDFYAATTLCFSFVHNALGWGIGIREADVHSASKVFTGVDLRIDWAGQKLQLYLDGVHEMQDAAFSNACSAGFDSIKATGNIWIDDFHVWCSSYILMSGSVAEHLSQADLVGGGSTITLLLVGGVQAWVQTDATKQAALDSLIADVTDPTGWNNKKTSMVSLALMKFPTPQSLVMGPFKAVSDFFSDAHEIVTFHLKGSMFTSGHIPLYHDSDVQFKINGFCNSDHWHGFDTAADVAPIAGFKHNTATKYQGDGSLEVTKAGASYRVEGESVHATMFSYYGQFTDMNSKLQVRINFDKRAKQYLTLMMANSGEFGYYLDGNGKNFGASSPGSWHRWDVKFDWNKREMTLITDKVQQEVLSMPAGVAGIHHLLLQQTGGSGGLFDSVYLACDFRDPTATVVPDCPKMPNGDAVTVTIHPGTDGLSVDNDAAAIISAASDCMADAETECATLKSCSTTSGLFKVVAPPSEGIVWTPDVMDLKATTDYQLCFYLGTFGIWIPIATFKTCDSGQIVTDVDECAASPCGTDQTCSDMDQAITGDYTCSCNNAAASNVGAPAVCDSDECKAAPCGTGQTCKDPVTTAASTGDYVCTCDADASITSTGAPAACDADECKAAPCGAGQTCNDPAPAAGSKNDYVCTCDADASITNTGAPAVCESDECKATPCGTGQTCKDPVTTVASTGDYVCTCDADANIKNTGAPAVCDADECKATPCGAGQTCNDPAPAAGSKNDYVCTCDADASIKSTGAPAVCESDECKATPCGTGQTCKDPVTTAASMGDYVCTCDADANIKNTGAPAVCDSDECKATPCGAGQTCKDPTMAAGSKNDYVCTCDADANIKNTGAPAVCDSDECKATPCGAGQTCKDPTTAAGSKNDYVCTCGADASITNTGAPAVCELDECQATPCGAGQTCQDPNKSPTVKSDYVCACNGVTATGAPAKCEQDECAAAPCGAGQKCTDPNQAANVLNDFVCQCNTDATITTTGGPATCEVNECGAAPCGAGQTCDDPNQSPSSTGDYTCTCTNKVVATGKPAKCTEDECSANPCGAMQTCNDPDPSANTLNDFVCTCTDDSTIKATNAPATCVENECTATPCGPGQTCEDGNQSPKSTGDFTCTCGNGVVATGNAAQCDADECTAVPCGAGQTCSDPDPAANALHDYVCTCASDAAITATNGPATCEKNECDAAPCGAEQTCADPNDSPASTGDYTCACSNGVTSTGGKATCEADECVGDPCGPDQTCEDPVKAANRQHDYVCTCVADSAITSIDGPATCSKNECDKAPCGQGQACVDPTPSPAKTGDFTCTCGNGVKATGNAASCETNECDTDPCGAGQTCRDPDVSADKLHDYMCACAGDPSVEAQDGPATCERDECAGSPCGAAQTCADGNKSPKALNDYVCSCANGVQATGGSAACETDECGPAPCGTGQTCSDPNKASNVLHDYICACVADPSLTAVNAPAICSTDECTSSPCAAGQQCKDPTMSPLSTSDFVCTCGNGVKATGAPAECEFDECGPLPCGVGQTCVDANPAFNSLNDYTCSCAAEPSIKKVHGAATCEKDECAGSPCTAGQSCEDPDKSPLSLLDYTCRCSNGVEATGAAATCEKDECAAGPCGSGQACLDADTAATALMDFVCTCDNDASVQKTGDPAVCVKDECAGQPCGASQTCDDPNKSAGAVGDFTCTCQNNPALSAAGGPSVCSPGTTDECAAAPGPCGPGQACVDPDQAATALNDFICSCQTGTGSAAGAPAACVVDECDADPCGAGQDCSDPNPAATSPNDYTCACRAPKTGTAVGARAMCALDECVEAPCGPGQTCLACGPGQTCLDPVKTVTGLHDFLCNCGNGASATNSPATCEVDECAAAPCGAEQTCDDPNKSAAVLNDYRCTCKSDATITQVAGLAACELDECTMSPCGNGQTCADPDKHPKVNGDFVCTCSNSVKATGAAAVCDIDECTSDPCGQASGQTCADPVKAANSVRDFTCTCVSDPTIVNTNGPAVCEKDECLDDPCGAGQTCKEAGTGPKSLHDFTCTCGNGVSATGASAQCSLDECLANGDPCGAGQTCKDPDTSAARQHDFVCTCVSDSSLTRTNGPATCTKNECDGKPCGAGQTCDDPQQTFADVLDYICKCGNGVTATGAPAACEVDECSTDPCGAGQTCRDPDTASTKQHDFICTCDNDQTITRKDGRATCERNECEADPCGPGQTCEDLNTAVSSLTDFTCRCGNGVQSQGAPALCDVDECSTSPCGDGQACVDPKPALNSQHDYVCTCLSDSAIAQTNGPALCSKNECDANPCGAAQTCEDPDQTVGSLLDYTCTCSATGASATGAPALCEADECTGNPCGAEQTCRDPDAARSRDFVCACANDPGVTSTGAIAPCALDECAADPCGQGQLCEDRNPVATSLSDYSCSCNGVTATGEPSTCNPDECASNPCGDGQVCVDPMPTAASTADFICSCADDSNVKSTGSAARCPGDECTAAPCGAGQTCKDANPMASSLGDFVCSCAGSASFNATGSPADCANAPPADECWGDPCDVATQTCQDPSPVVAGDYVCTCVGNGETAVAARPDCSRQRSAAEEGDDGGPPVFIWPLLAAVVLALVAACVFLARRRQTTTNQVSYEDFMNAIGKTDPQFPSAMESEMDPESPYSSPTSSPRVYSPSRADHGMITVASL